MSVTVIAEAGVNHNGDMGTALQLIEAAAASGADYVKFQTFVADELVTRDAPKANYQRSTTDHGESQYDMIKRLELSRSDHLAMIGHCRESGIGFCSTAFNATSIELLAEFDLDFFKIPSGEIDNVPYLRQIAGMRRPIILSTGMATLSDVEFAIQTLEIAGTPRDDITVLHCNTQYPTPMQDVNLNAMLTIRDALKVRIGYSDHTLGTDVPIAAVALGATVIEKHFTLDRSMPGPDHAASLEPDELKAMVKAIRNIEIAMGDGIKHPSASESLNRSIVRKSIVARQSIRQGERFSIENLTVKRPGTGLSPTLWDQLLGKAASRDFARDELVEW